MAINIKEYSKNLAKSLGYVALDTFQMNTLVATVDENKDTIKDIYKGIRDFAHDPKEAVKNNKFIAEYSPIVKDGFKNLMEDIKTGNFYNKDREDQAYMDAAGGGDSWDFDFEDFGDMSSFDDYDSEESPKESSAMVTAKAKEISNVENIKAMDIVGKTTARSINTVTAKSAQYIVQAQQAATGMLLKQQSQMFNQVSIGLAGVNKSLGALVGLGEPLTAHMQNSIKFYTETSQKLDKMVNLLEGINNSLKPSETSSSRKSYTGMEAFFGSSGNLSLSGIKEMLGKNFGKAMDSSMLGTLSNFQIGEDKNNIWKLMAANPLGTILSFALPSMLPKSFMDSVDKLGKSLAGFNMQLIKRLSKMGGNPVKDFIGQLFNYDDNLRTNVDTSKYNKGKVDFDGKTRKAIIEVIPAYLSKILVALTGGFETRYNYDTGKFMNRQQIMEANREVFKNAASNMGSDFSDIENIENLLRSKNKGKNKNKEIDKKKAEEYKKSLDKYFSNALKTNNLIDPSKKYSAKDAEKFGLTLQQFQQVQELYKYYARTGQYHLIMELDGNLNRQRLAISEHFANAGEDGIENSIYNESMNTGTFGGSARAVADMGSYAGQFIQVTNNKSSRGKNKKPNGYKELNKSAAKASSRYKIKYTKVEFTKKIKEITDLKPAEKRRFLSEYDEFFGKNRLEHSEDERLEFIRELDRRASNDGTKWETDSDKKDKSESGPKAFFDKIREVIEKPFTVVTDILNKADKTLFEIIYGKVDDNGNVIEDENHKSVLSMMFLQMKDMFTTFKNWAQEKIFDPVKNWLDSKGGLKGILSSFLGIDIDQMLETAKAGTRILGRRVGENFKSVGKWGIDKLKGLKDEFSFGSGSMISSKKYYGGRSKAAPEKHPSNELLQQAYEEINKGKTIKQVAKELNIDYNVLQKKNKVENPEWRFKTEWKKVKKGTQEIINDKDGMVYKTGEALNSGLGYFFKHIIPDDKELGETGEKAKKVVQSSLKSLGVDPSGAITGALMGGGLSILSGGIISPMLAASIGSAAGLVISSESVQKALFGEEVVNSNGEKERDASGLLSKQVTDFLTKKLPSVAGFSVAGGLAGLLPIMPGGPIGGMILGAGIGFMKKSETVQEFLFGSEEKGTAGIFGTQEDKKKKLDWLKKMAPKAAAGAILGAVAGPFGFAGNIMVGSALGFASETETFKKILFGEEEQVGTDENGNPIMERKGGITGMIKNEIVTPLGKAIVPIATELKHNAKSIIHNTGKMIASAFSKIFASVTRPLWDKLGTFVLGPMAKALGGVFKGVTKIATSPFKMLRAFGNHLEEKQVRGGYATHMSAKERHEMTLQKGWAPSGFTDADASMMTMGSEDLSKTLGDINSLLNIGNKYGAQNNFNRSAVKVGNIVRKLAGGRAGYKLAVQAQNMAAAGKSSTDIINFLQSANVKLTPDVIQKIEDAMKNVGEAESKLADSNAARAMAEANIRRIYNLGEDFELNDKNLLRLQETTSHELSLRNAKGDKHVGEVQKSVQETLQEVADAHTDRIEKRMVDIINTIRRIFGMDEIKGGTEDSHEAAANITSNDQNRNNGSTAPVDSFGGIMTGRRNFFQAMHSVWNPLHDMDVPSTEAAIQYYEYVTLGKGSVSDIKYSLEECGVSTYDQLASRVRQIAGKENLICVTDKNFRAVNLHKIGDVWYYAASHNLMELIKESRVGKAIVGGIKTVGKVIKNTYIAARLMLDPFYNFDPEFVDMVLSDYAASLENPNYISAYVSSYITVDPDFPEGNVITVKDDDGHMVKVRKSGNTWVWANPIWLGAHKGIKRVKNLITTGIKTAKNIIHGIGKGVKSLYTTVRRKMNPFYDFTREERDAVEMEAGRLSQEGGSGEYLKEVEGMQGIYKVTFPNKPNFYVDLRSGTAKYVSPEKIKAMKAKNVVTGIGGAVKSVFNKISGGVKNVINTFKGSNESGSGSGLISASRYYRGGGAWDTIKGIAGGLGKAAGGIGSALGGIGDFFSSGDDDDVKEKQGFLSKTLQKINNSKFNPKNFLSSNSTDYNLGSKEEREAFRKQQSTLNIFRETTFTTNQISEKMDVLIGGLFGAGAGAGSAAKSSGGLFGGSGGFFGSLLASLGASAAAVAGLYALLSGKADGLLEGAYNSVNVDNVAPGSGGLSNYTVDDPKTGETKSIATKDGKAMLGTDPETGDIGWVSTDGTIIPMNGAYGELAEPSESSGTSGAGQKLVAKNIRNIIRGTPTLFTLTRKFLMRDSLASRTKLGRFLSNTRLGQAYYRGKTSLGQFLDDWSYGTSRTNLNAKFNQLPGINGALQRFGNTKFGQWVAEQYAEKARKQAIDFTYKRFERVFGKEAPKKWMEYIENGSEKFLRDNYEELGRSKSGYLFTEALTDADMTTGEYAENFNHKISKKASKAAKKAAKEGAEEAGETAVQKAEKEAVEKATNTAAQVAEEKGRKAAAEEAGEELLEKSAKEGAEEAGETAVQKAEKEAVGNATERVEKELFESASAKANREGYQAAVEKAAKKGAEEVTEEIYEESAAAAAQRIGREKILKETGQEAIQSGTVLGVKAAGVEAVEEAVQNTVEVGAKEAAQSTTQKQLKSTLKDMLKSVWTAIFGTKTGKNAIEQMGFESAEKAGEQLADEMSERLEKEIAKKAPKDTVEGAVESIPIAGWIATALFAVYEFEEGWNSAERYFKVKECTVPEKLICGISAMIIEILGGIGSVWTTIIQFIPINLIISLFLDVFEYFGWLPDGLIERRKDLQAAFDAWNEDRAKKGLAPESMEKYFTSSSKVGGLEMRTWGEHVTGFFEDQEIAKIPSEAVHAKYLNKLYNNEITFAQYMRANKDYGLQWVDPTPVNGYMSSLNVLEKYDKKTLEQGFPSYEQYYSNYADKYGFEDDQWRSLNDQYNEYVTGLQQSFGNDWNLHYDYNNAWSKSEYSNDILDPSLQVTTNNLRALENKANKGTLQTTDPRYKVENGKGSGLLRGKGSKNILWPFRGGSFTRPILPASAKDIYDPNTSSLYVYDSNASSDPMYNPETFSTSFNNNNGNTSTTTINSDINKLGSLLGGSAAFGLFIPVQLSNIGNLGNIIKTLQGYGPVSDETLQQIKEGSNNNYLVPQMSEEEQKASEDSLTIASALKQLITGQYGELGEMFGMGSRMLLKGKGSGFVSQVNPSISNTPFGDSTFGQNGCAPAVASMLTGMSVGSTAGYAMGGGYTNASGTSADYFGNILSQNGIPSEYVFTGRGSATDYLESNIASGRPTVLLGQDYSNTSKANSPFGPGDHYVLATGKTSSGDIIVQDPEANRPNITYNRSILNNVKLGIPTGGASRLIGKFKRGLSRALSLRGSGSFGISENHKQIWTFLINNGFSDAGAAGLMGCWQAESGNRPDRIEGDYVKSFPGFDKVASDSSELDAWTEKLFGMYANKGLKIKQSAYKGSDGHYYPGFGLAQWTGGRGYNLLSYCKRMNYDWKQLLSQLKFAMNEFETNYKSVYAVLKSATDVMDACAAAFHGYEGCSREDWLKVRQSYAVGIYNELSGKTYTMPTDTGSASDNIYGMSSTSGNANSEENNKNEDSSKDTIGTLGDAFRKLFAGALGGLGKLFGLSSYDDEENNSYDSDSSVNGDYGSSGNVIEPDTERTTELKPLPAMNSSHAVNFVNSAMSQVGYVETPDNITDFGEFTGAQGQPWCASFVSWAMNKAFKGNAEHAARALYGGPTASVSTLWDRFKSNDAMSSTPSVGDVVIYKNGTSHTGIVAKVNGNNIETVEGNTSGDQSFDRNGGMVWTKDYDYTSKSNLTGFGRPNWAAIPEDLSQKGYSESTTSGSAGSTLNFDAGRARRANASVLTDTTESKYGSDGLTFNFDEARARKNANNNSLLNGVAPAPGTSISSTTYPTGSTTTNNSLFNGLQTVPLATGKGSGLVSYNVAQAGYNTINGSHRRAKSVFGRGSGIVDMSKLSKSSRDRYVKALQTYAGSGALGNDAMITLIKGIISLLSNVSANSDQIKEAVVVLNKILEATGNSAGAQNDMNINMTTAANDMALEDTDSTIREMQQLLSNLAMGA